MHKGSIQQKKFDKMAGLTQKDKNSPKGSQKGFDDVLNDLEDDDDELIDEFGHEHGLFDALNTAKIK